MRLMTVGSLPPEWGGPQRGGVASFHAALLSGLLERGGEVEIVGVIPPAPLQREVPVPVLERPQDVLRAVFYEDALQRVRPDLVLMNHIAHTYGVAHAGLRSAPPALGVIHSWHAVTFRAGEERRRAFSTTAEAMAGMAALAIPSHHALGEGRELGFDYPALVEVIHNPLQPLYMSDDLDGPVARRGIVYLGGLIPRKDPSALIGAAALSPGLEVTLIGEGELDGELRAAIAGHGLTDRVRLADLPSGEGHLEAVRAALLGASAFCLPSRSESFGIVFAEALACGTPVVGYGPVVREIRDAMGVEIGEPLDSGRPEEIAAALERVQAARWDRELLRRAALDAFGLTRVTGRYLDLFRCVVDGAGGR
jgi:glycosyltransferase involved in cell wall biosynthesis